jgi:disulfide bond formation protein DsbB
MKIRKLVFTATAVMGIVSFLIVIVFYGALHDIWHEIGRPDIWHGQGPAAFEWRLIAIAYWPMLLFHVLFLVSLWHFKKDKKKD